MFSRRSLCAFAVALTASLIPAGFAAAQDAPKIRTVNPGKIFNEMQETKDLKQSITAKSQGLQAKQKQFEDELKELERQRTLFVPGTPDHAKANTALINGAVTYKAWQEITKAELAREQKGQMIKLFAKIEAATAEVSKAQGLDLVVVEQKIEMPKENEAESLSVDQIRGLINQRNVMFSNDKLDITQAVLDKVNENYKNQK